MCAVVHPVLYFCLNAGFNELVEQSCPCMFVLCSVVQHFYFTNHMQHSVCMDHALTDRQALRCVFRRKEARSGPNTETCRQSGLCTYGISI